MQSGRVSRDPSFFARESGLGPCVNASRTVLGYANRGAVALLLGLIRVYQLTLSPFIGNQCRFYPSCSHYAAQALSSHGAIAGSWLSVKRILRCQPLCAGGPDPVPPVTKCAAHSQRRGTP